MDTTEQRERRTNARPTLVPAILHLRTLGRQRHSLKREMNTSVNNRQGSNNNPTVCPSAAEGASTARAYPSVGTVGKGKAGPPKGCGDASSPHPHGNRHDTPQSRSAEYQKAGT